ncbi:flagellar M-ring protein [Oxobacter pfennigii]|uniref:Flagellar M-ring protein n=1 Tax=Oxobacter pfennigii TaxID=36849 RepID=A0A0P8YC41_9CLOT|nr:flagellar basal-body MS-ring/collar protein FliF [Oxobacter pfennigii]KPU44687.1 flagellar M-ring protein [Oxobacter pfennigii]
MGALRNILSNVAEGWKNISNGRKVAIIVLAGGVISALIFFIVFFNKPQYEPLFSNMAPEDMAKVAEKLKEDKINYKPDGTTLLVPKDKVEEIRLTVASSGIMPSDGKGFELFDESRFGMTDTETRILYQRALETELQRTIKAFEEIEYARVHLVLPQESVFYREQEQARASVTLKFKHNMRLSPEQVRAVVALVSGSVKNLPKENVEVVDSNFNLLSEELFNADINAPTSVNDRYEIKKQFETKIGSDIKNMLESVFGPNRVKVSVNADLDFDAKQVTSIRYDPEGIIENQHRILESSTSTGGNTTYSPMDENTGAPTFQNNPSTSTRTSEEDITNYKIGQVEEKTIKAPGEVKKMTASVVIDGTLSEAAKASVQNIVASAIGYDVTRGDMISIEGMPFDNSLQRQVQADLEELENQRLEKERRQRQIMLFGIPGAIVLLIIALIVYLRIRALRRAKQNIDIVIDEPIAVNEVIKQQILEDDAEREDLTSEIKKYASKKPEQVIEIVKSWLVEDER